jgi:hypothetical protein
MVGTGGFEPPTPSVSGKCSPTELRAWNRLSLENRSKQQQPVTDIPKSGNRSRSLGHPRSLAEAHEANSARRPMPSAIPSIVNMTLPIRRHPMRSPAKERKLAVDQLKTRNMGASGLALEMELAAGRMVEATRGKRSTSIDTVSVFSPGATPHERPRLGPGTVVEQNLRQNWRRRQRPPRQGAAGGDLRRFLLNSRGQ